jgi:hypothetical protein
MRTIALLLVLSVFLAGCLDDGEQVKVSTNKTTPNQSKNLENQTLPVNPPIIENNTLPITPPAKENKTQPTPTPTPSPQVKTIGENAFALEQKQYGYCRALAPADWAFVSNEQASAADAFAPGYAMHAGWGVAAVPSYMYPTIDDFLDYWMPCASYPNPSFAPEENEGDGYYSREFTSGNKKGIILYKEFPGTQDFYVVTVRMASTDASQWEENKALVANVALSINCVTQLVPSSGESVVSEEGTLENSEGDVSLEDKWSEAILGYENVYSPTTGEHWEVPLNAYDPAGPDGPGYYRAIPNGFEKLERGFGY